MTENVIASCIALASCIVAPGFAYAGNLTNTWKNVSANTPDTAYEWNEISNWDKEERGIPNGVNAGVQFSVTHDSDVFIKLPENLTLGYLQTWAGGNDIYLMGEKISIESSSRAVLNGGKVLIYGDMDVKVSDNRLGNGVDLQVAGNLFYSGTGGRPILNGLTHRFDLFAEQAGEQRTSRLTSSGGGPQSYAAGYLIYAPGGADEQKGFWNQTEGSPYLKLVGTAHDLAVGTLVYGDGIPENTFLKRIYGENWIELSTAATKTKSGNELIFAAFTPDFTQTIDSLTMAAPYTARFAVLKKRPNDQAKLLCNFTFGSNSKTCAVTFGLTDDEIAKGYYPGEIDLRTVSTASGSTGSKLSLANCKLLLTGNNKALAFKGLNISNTTVSAKAELCVPAETAASVDSFTAVNGTLVKTGTGSLSIKVKSATNEGSLIVSEGVLTVENSTETSGPLVLGAIELAATGTLIVPATGISVGRLVAAKGSRVMGGLLTVTGSVQGLPMPMHGAEVSVPVRDCSARVVPADGRWMHLDAERSDKFEFKMEDEERHVAKWYDLSGGGCYAKADSGLPWFRENASNGLPMVDLGDAVWSRGRSTGGTGAAITSRGLSFYQADGTALSGANVEAAFYVVDSAKGGGALLSKAGANFPQYGVPYWPEKGLGVAPILGFNGAGNGDFQNADINEGSAIFRTNGISIYPRSAPFSGGIDVISFTNNASVNGKVMGRTIGCVIGGGADYDKSANGLAFGEVILFTNGVSASSMLDIEAYLAKKWLGRKTDGYWMCVDTLGGMTDSQSKISVLGGGTIETARLVTGGCVEGDVELLSEGSLEVVVSPTGVIEPLSVVGIVKLPDVIGVKFSGFYEDLKNGTYDIVSASEFAGAVNTAVFNVEKPSGMRKIVSMKVIGSKIVLTVVSPGLRMVIK